MKRLPLLVGLLLLFFLTWHSARAGYASLLTASVVSAKDVDAVSKAVRLSPGDPHAHVLLGALLEANEDRASAIPLYRTAVALRPDDYVLRMQLARGQELEGDAAAAIASATVAVSLAPSYAQPHWQLGNILVRAGRNDEGFRELGLAGISDPGLLPPIIDLAWQISKGDVEAVKRLIAPQSPLTYVALGEYLKKRKKAFEAVAMFTAAGAGSEAALARKQYVNELVNAKEFKAAYQLWKIDSGVTASEGPGVIVNPGFEMESDLDESFGWRTTDRAKTIALSLDNADPKEGRSSLRIDFNGATNSGAEVISQLVLVAPKTHYRLNFAVRTEALVSGGLPNFTVVAADDNKLLGETGALPQTTNAWQGTTIDFTTGDATTAIRMSLKRQACAAPQCPIFGKLWLDDFLLMGPGHVGEG